MTITLLFPLFFFFWELRQTETQLISMYLLIFSLEILKNNQVFNDTQEEEEGKQGPNNLQNE